MSKSVPQDLPRKVGENADRLASLTSSVDWKKLVRVWLIILSMVSVSLFVIIAVVRLANKI